MKWIKYTLVKGISAITGRCVVNLFGSTYIVASNYVRRIR
jgi:hypothetical protein